MKPRARLGLLFAVLFTALAPLALEAFPARFRLQTEASPPFERLTVWAPPAGLAATGMFTLLHGNQGASPPDPTWLAWLRAQPPFDRWVLVVPSVDPNTRWNDPAVIASLSAVVERQTREHQIPPERSYLFGFSAGASRGYAVMAALPDRFAGFVAFAGFPGKTTLSSAQLRTLAGERLLLLCGANDQAVPCSGADAARARLVAAGARDVERVELPGVGHECPLPIVAPVLARWVEAAP